MKAAIGLGPVIETRLRHGPFEAEIRLRDGSSFHDVIEGIRGRPSKNTGGNVTEVRFRREGWLWLYAINRLDVPGYPELEA